MQAYKNNAYVQFDETIRMDRFIDRATPQKKVQASTIQAELTTCRERIQILSKGKVLDDGYCLVKLLTTFQPSPSEALAQTANFLAQEHGIAFDSIDATLIEHIRDEVSFVADELALLRHKATELKRRLEEVWVDSTEIEYELTSVFIHRGTSPTFGHYFFYARHLPRFPDRWFKYNDAEVTEVSKEEVFADTTGQTANPYLVGEPASLMNISHPLN
jgi:ubiquitin carboxyl-terminal hydrolase 25